MPGELPGLTIPSLMTLPLTTPLPVSESPGLTAKGPVGVIGSPGVRCVRIAGGALGEAVETGSLGVVTAAGGAEIAGDDGATRPALGVETLGAAAIGVAMGGLKLLLGHGLETI